MSNSATLTKPTQEATATRSGARPPFWASLTRTVVWAAIALTGVILLTEGLFAVTHIGEEEFVDIHPVVGFWRMPNKMVTWRSEGYAHDVTNNDGMRDISFTLAKPPGVKRIAAVGDSMVEGYQVSRDQTFIKQLASRLNQDGIKTEGLNFGMSGYSTAQALYLFKEKILKYRPDVLILAYHAGDNEKNNYIPTPGSFMPRPHVLLQDGIVKTDWRGYDSWWNGPMRNSYETTHWLRTNSRLWGVYTKTELQLSEQKWYSKFKKSLEHKPAKAAATTPERFTSTANDFGLTDTKFNTSFAALPEAHWLYLPMPSQLPPKEAAELAKERDFATGWRRVLYCTNERFAATAATIDVLNRACQKANCKLVVAGLPAPSNALLYKRELEMMEKVARQSGFIFINVNAEFPQIAPMQKNDYYYNVHFTPRGHEAVTDVLHRHMKDKGLLDYLRSSP